jgi:integrase
MRTMFPCEIDVFQTSDTLLTQETPESEGAKVRFPKKIKYRGRTLATIYAKSKGRDSYRVSWVLNGKRQMASFASYSLAKRHADKLAKDLSKGSVVSALNPAQARDALAAFERLQSFYQLTGRRVSLLAAVSEFAESSAKVNGRPLNDVMDDYLRTVAVVKRKDLAQAVEDFITAEEPKTKAPDGQRAQLAKAYFYNRAIQLRRFAATFQNTAICDLTKELVDAFIGSLGKIQTKSRNHRAITSAKTRNGYRAAVRQFLQWAVRKDYLNQTHRLFEADTMRPEPTNSGDVLFYTPRELANMLTAANDTLRPIIAIGGLAGLRTAEILRLTWADVWRVEGHIEVTSGKAKTRQRRLVEIGGALANWLEPFRATAKGKLWDGHEVTFQQHFVALCETAKVERKHNGLRHSFCSYHFALHANENQTAAQAGHSPAMVHQHYKGLATKAEGEKWFNVQPEKIS